MKKFLRYSGFILSALVILVLAGFTIWAGNPAEPQPESTQSLDDTPEVKFTKLNNWLVFEPTASASVTGLILYPGGRVDPQAYAPHAQAIAANGFSVIVVPMPLNFAFLGVNRATQVIEAFPGIKHWAVGGHSLGGAMAAEFVKDHPQEIDGLALWASYPAENTDLSALEIQAMSIYATNDGLATAEEVLSARPRLPAGTRFVEIPGGNHAGFGWYGPQGGDGELEITKLTQQSQIVESMVFFLYGLRKE
jgi:hypothetical protein